MKANRLARMAQPMPIENQASFLRHWFCSETGADVEIWTMRNKRIAARIEAIKPDTSWDKPLVFDIEENPEAFEWWVQKIDFFKAITYPSKIEVYVVDFDKICIVFLDLGSWTTA